MRYHGNYCGPNWSAGKHQESVIDNNVPAVDEFDQTCLEHDAEYARYRDDTYEEEVDLDEADEKFYRQNYGKSFKRTLAAIAVNMARRGGRKKPSKKRIAKTVKKEVKKMVPRVRRMAKPRAILAPVLARGRSQKRKRGMKFKSQHRGDNVIITGRDFYGAVTVTNTQKAGDTIVGGIDLNPQSFTNSRLSVFGKLYEKFQILSFTVEFKSSCPSTSAGSLIHYFHPDYYDAPSGGAAAINIATSTNNYKEMQVWQNSSVTFRPEKKMSDMYTSENGTDQRLASYGHYFLLAATDFGTAASLGNIFIHYKIKFMKAINELTTVTSLGEYTGNSPSTSDLVGTSITQVTNSYGSYLTKGGTSALNFTAPGTYFVVANWSLTCTTGGDISIAGTTASISQEVYPYISTTASTYLHKCKVVVTAAGQYIQYGANGGLVLSAVSAFKVYITPAFSGMQKPESREDIQNKKIADIERQLKDLLKIRSEEKRKLIEDEYEPRRPGTSRSQSPTRRFP